MDITNELDIIRFPSWHKFDGQILILIVQSLTVILRKQTYIWNPSDVFVEMNRPLRKTGPYNEYP